MQARRIVLTLAAVFVVVVSGTSLIRTVRAFYRLDFSVSWVEQGLVINEVPPGSSAEAAGLKPRDTVIGVDGVPLGRLDDPAFMLAGGEEHVLSVRHGDGLVSEVTFRSPPPAINSVYLARTAVGFFGLGCALYALWGTRRREAATFVLLAMTALILGAVPNRIAATELLFQVIRRGVGAALPFLIVRLFAIFPDRDRSMRLWDILTLTAAVASGATALLSDVEAWWPAVTSLLRALFVSSMIFGIVLQIWRWRSASREVRVRRQIEWAALGLFVGLVPFLVLVMIPRWIGIPFAPFTWLAVFPISAIPLTWLAALKGYRLWDLEPISRDSLSATLVVVTGGFIFTITNHLLLSYAGGVGSLRNLFAGSAARGEVPRPVAPPGSPGAPLPPDGREPGACAGDRSPRGARAVVRDLDRRARVRSRGDLPASRG